MPNPDDLRGSEQAKPFNPPSTPTAPHSLQQQIQMACLPRAEWQPIETIPYGAEALFLGELWAHPYVGIRNGSGGMAYLYGFNNPEHGWQAYDATRWMPICDQRGRAANYLKRDDEAQALATGQAPIPANTESSSSEFPSSGAVPEGRETASCNWHQDDHGGDTLWATDCKHDFYFDGADGPKDAGFTTCPFCGKALTESRTSDLLPPAPETRQE